jgi:hypothetical protein
MEENNPKPTSAVWKGVIIAQFSSFRYDTTVREQQFFQLKFRQPFNSPFIAGTDDPEIYNETPIILNFEQPSGKIKPVNANVIKVSYVSSPGQQSEILIGGTIYRPTGNIPKFSLLVLTAFMLPILALGSLYLHVTWLRQQLTALEGNVRSFQDSSYKRHKRFTFKVSPYSATFYREYYRPMFNTSTKNIEALFMSDYDGYHQDSTGQWVTFYVFKNDSAKLYQSNEKVTFFNLTHQKQAFSNTGHFLDVLYYATDKTWVYFAWILFLAMEVISIIFAYYLYKMHALYHQRRNRLLWWSGVILTLLLNLVVVAVIE